MKTQEIEKKISGVTRKLIDDFENYPDKYLTESDVRCFLFQRLMSCKEFNQLQQTKDSSFSIPLHTEVRWYGKSGKLRWRSDIVVVDVSSLRVKNNIFRLPSKGYEFNKPLAIIEIKLRRTIGSSDNTFIKKVHEDIHRLKEIRNKLPGDYVCFLVILDKKNNIEKMIKSINREEKIKIIYKYSNNRKAI